MPRIWASSSLVPNRHRWSRILGCGVSLSVSLGSKPSPRTPITRTGLGPVQFSASPLSDIPKFREERERGWSFSIQGSVRGTNSGPLSCCLFPFSRTALSSAEAPAGYPNKNSNKGKTRGARGTIGRGKRREPSPSHTAARSLFFLPSFATTQRGLYGGESPHSLSNRGLFSSKLCLRGLRCCSRPSSSKDDQV